MSKKCVYKDNSIPWSGLILGCMLIGSSLFGLLMIDDGYIWRGVYIPIWGSWIMLPAGVGITVTSIYALIHGKGKPTTYTDEETAQAEAEMDAMYLRQYGELPEKPKPEIVVDETVEPEKPQKDTE